MVVHQKLACTELGPCLAVEGEGQMRQVRRSRDGSLLPLVLALALFPLVSLAQEATPAANVPYSPRTDLNQLTGRIIADGSSTVWPVTAEAGERFMAMAPVIVEVELSGTGGGFRRFCAGESDLQNASRPINDDEIAACAAAGVEYEVFPLGFDGITVTVNPKNTWAHCLTVAQLKALWEPDGTVHTWKELDPSWPDLEVELYGPGPDSGTFDYFTEVIVGEPGPPAPTISRARTTSISSRGSPRRRTHSAISATPTSPRTPAACARWPSMPATVAWRHRRRRSPTAAMRHSPGRSISMSTQRVWRGPRCKSSSALPSIRRRISCRPSGTYPCPPPTTRRTAPRSKRSRGRVELGYGLRVTGDE